MHDEDTHVRVPGLREDGFRPVQLRLVDAPVHDGPPWRRGIQGDDHGLPDPQRGVELVRDGLPVVPERREQALPHPIERHVVIAGRGHQWGIGKAR